jgi:hypothetical protein
LRCNRFSALRCGGGALGLFVRVRGEMTSQPSHQMYISLLLPENITVARHHTSHVGDSQQERRRNVLPNLFDQDVYYLLLRQISTKKFIYFQCFLQ